VNIYRHQFISTCPENGKPIIYQLEIQADKMIRVEHIVTACQLYQQDFHERIADDLFARFGATQTLKAHHHGVDIETIRSAA
jgi:hypothetical protein